ncbi:MAG: hypothetical protein F4Y03_00475 [Alphaproteobacteria bacterium]|nr:hypothetical protein [Alphaproteobacteria bacterium]
MDPLTHCMQPGGLVPRAEEIVRCGLRVQRDDAGVLVAPEVVVSIEEANCPGCLKAAAEELEATAAHLRARAAHERRRRREEASDPGWEIGAPLVENARRSAKLPAFLDRGRAGASA